MARIITSMPGEPQEYTPFTDAEVEAFGRIRERIASLPLAFEQTSTAVPGFITAASEFIGASDKLSSALEQKYIEWIKREQQERINAHNRAEALLLSCLDDGQRADYEQHGGFNIHKGRWINKRTYRVLSGNPVVSRRDSRLHVDYCVVIGADIPRPDLMLAIKMMIESDEKRFLEVANVVTRIYITSNDTRPRWPYG